MKISAERLKQIVKEELNNMSEGFFGDVWSTASTTSAGDPLELGASTPSKNIPSYSTALSEQVSDVIKELMYLAGDQKDSRVYEKIHEIITKLKPIRDKLVNPKYNS